jgi:hypothetical protein
MVTAIAAFENAELFGDYIMVTVVNLFKNQGDTNESRLIS